jgi:hypothetical protein
MERFHREIQAEGDRWKVSESAAFLSYDENFKI